jgi:hypothetical protein
VGAYLFTTDEQQAIQTFALYLVLSKVTVSRMWFSEITPSVVIPEHRAHLEEALSRGIEAFGSYQAGEGWEMQSVQDRFDELATASVEGGVL